MKTPMKIPFQQVNHTLFSLAALLGLVWGAVVFVRGENQQAIWPLERRLERVEAHVARIPRLEANQEVMLRQLANLQKSILKKREGSPASLARTLQK